MRNAWWSRVLLCSASAAVLASCGDDREPPDPWCGPPAAMAIAPVDSAANAPGMRVDDVVLVNDSVAVWLDPDHNAIRRTQLSTGCTTVMARLIAPANGYHPFGAESWRLHPKIPNKVLPVDSLNVPSDFSIVTTLARWSGDSVALYDSDARRITVLSVGIPRVRRSFADTSYFTRTRNPFGELDDRRFDVTYTPVSATASPAESVLVEQRGVLVLRERAGNRAIARLPVHNAPTLIAHGKFGDVAMWTPDFRGSLIVVGGSRLAVTNYDRDSLRIADIDGRQWQVGLPLSPVQLSAPVRAAKRAAWLRAMRRLPGSVDSAVFSTWESLLSVPESEPRAWQLLQRDSTTFVVYRDSGGAVRDATPSLILATADTQGTLRRCVALPTVPRVLAVGHRVVVVLGIDSVIHLPRFRTVPLSPACMD